MTQQVILSKNKLFFFFLFFSYIFGVILYDSLAFDYTDEIMALYLVLFSGIIAWERKNVQDLRSLVIIISIFIFYTIYSFIIKSNIPQAILKDLVIQIKPFLGFYCTWLIAPILTKQQKQIISILCLIVGGIILIAVLTGNLWSFFGHPSRLATSSIITALLFLYCSSYSWEDIIVFILLLSIGFFSTRSKFYGFWGVSVFFIIYYKTGGIIKINLKSIIILLITIGVGIALSWKKIVIYYIDGAINSEQMWSRPAMMLTGLQILYDYFPFGCGLASFGTFISGEYYSKIYSEYGIDHLYGISKDWPSFIADAYYPELAQFGIVGVVLYFFFWTWVIRQVIAKKIKSHKIIVLTLLIPIFFFIEGIADATLVSNRGVFIMILLGMVFTNITTSQTN